MHPTRPHVALRVGTNLQVFDLSSQKNLTATVMPDAVAFWRWLGPDVLAIVTTTAVYHWEPAADAEPKCVFDRHASLEGCQIIGYAADRTQKWLSVVGISAEPGAPIEGRLQLYSVAKNLSQVLDGHAATFAYLPLASYEATLFLFASRLRKPDTGEVESMLRIIEVGGRGEFGKVSSDIYYPPEFSNDFPIAIQVSTKYPTIVYLITKMGYLHLYDLETAKCIYMNHVSDTTIFTTTPHTASGGLMGLNRKGQVLLMSARPENVIPYVRRNLEDEELAAGLASRNGFRGAEAGFANNFEDAMEDQLYSKATQLAAESPGGFLRTVETIERFRAIPSERKGGPPPALVYFQTCLDRGKLNSVESVELSKQLISSKKTALLEKWIKEDKLEFSEGLGDVVREASPTMVLAIFIKAKAHEKVVQCMTQTGQTSKVALYAKKVGMKVTHRDLVDMTAQFDPQAALKIANNSSNALVLVDPAKKKESIEDIGRMVDMFLSKGMLNEATSHAMDTLTDEDPDEGPIQTKILKGVAKVYVNTNRNAQHFLETNLYYDLREVGKFCSRRDPYLAFIAYRRGQCDEEVLQLTNDNSLFRKQAVYAVDRADADLWAKIFAEDNPFRRLVVDQVISTAMPESKKPEKVSAAVRAFLDAGMPDVLMEMLKKLVIQTSNTAFARDTNLQNLLILTAIGAAPERVMEYVRQLGNYDGPDVAPSCVGAGLFEEAHTIYYKFAKYDDALDVLLDHSKDFDRAQEFAVRMNRAEVWLRFRISKLENGLVADGVTSLMRAEDVTQHALIVGASRYQAETASDFKMIAKFMRVARRKIREPELVVPAIDTELVYSLCRLHALTDVEEFIVATGHKANLEEAGDRCFDIELFQAAKMMFRAVPVYSKLAHTHITFCCRGGPTDSPLFVSQTFNVPSHDPDTIRRPSPLTATRAAQFVWPRSGASTHPPLPTSHMVNVLSRDQDTIRRPSSLIAT